MAYGKLFNSFTPGFAGEVYWLVTDASGRTTRLYPDRLIAAVHPVANAARNTPEEEAQVRLIFEEDDAIQRRVVQAIQDLFFGAEGRFGTGPKRNCQALQRQLFDTVSPEDIAFKKAVEAVFRDRVAQALDRIVAEELEKVVAKHVATFDKASRRIAAAPKGPHK